MSYVANSVTRRRAIVPIVRKKNSSSIVYVVCSGEYVKFGRTIRLKERLKELQYDNPVAVELIGYMIGAHWLEAQVHQSLKKYRIHGEWYRYTGAVKSVTDLMADPKKHWLVREQLDRLAGQSYARKENSQR